MTSEYVLKLATKASELFESSEPQEKRLLLKMALQDLELDGKYIVSKWVKPFDKIVYYTSRNAWLPLVDLFKNRKIEIDIQLPEIKNLFSNINFQPNFATV